MAIVLAFTFYSSIMFILKNDNMIFKAVGAIVFFSALWLAAQRDTYLPFLADAAFPAALVKDAYIPDHANVETVVNVNEPNGTKIAFWGALPSDKVATNPRVAYSDYKNAGVAEVNNGKATLKFWCPSKYNIPFGMTLDRHVHYRVLDANGMMSSVKTVFVKC